MAKRTNRQEKAKWMPEGIRSDAGNTRRIQAVLNGNHVIERPAVNVLDWAKQQMDSTGKNLSDRIIIREALTALGEKWMEGFTPPEPVPTVQPATFSDLSDLATFMEGIVSAAVNSIVSSLDGGNYVKSADWAAKKGEMNGRVSDAVNEAISTNHLSGESYRIDDDDED